MHPDGTGEEHLGYGGTEWGEDYRPTPSTDGREVAYGSFRSPCGVTDCGRVLDIATGVERILVSGSNAAWSPTSDVIAYASRTGVGLIHADGTGQQLLAADVRDVGWMDWSPDGRWLLVSPGVGPVILFDTTNGMRLPLATFAAYGATAWRQDVTLANAHWSSHSPAPRSDRRCALDLFPAPSAVIRSFASRCSSPPQPAAPRIQPQSPGGSQQ